MGFQFMALKVTSFKLIFKEVGEGKGIVGILLFFTSFF